MTLTVATIINNARDLHPALSKTNAPDEIAFRALSRFQRQMVQDIATNVPAFLAAEVEVPFPLAVFDDGIDLATLIPGGWQDLLDGFLLYANTPNNRRVRIEFVPWEQRDMFGGAPRYTFRDNVLYFLGGEDQYAQVSSFFLTYTAIAPSLTALTSTVLLTDDSLDALALMLAGEWLMRMVGNPSFGVSAEAAGLYMQRGEAMRLAYVTRVRRLAQRQRYAVRDTQARGNPL